MKKTILALALVLGLGIGLNATNALAWCGGYGNGNGAGYHHRGGGMGGGMGGGCNFAAMQNNPDFQKFLDATKELRASLAADRGEFRALMAGQNPDPARARALSESIFTKRTELAEKAQAMNVSWNCRGAGMGYGQGAGCNGTGPGPRKGMRN